MSSSNHATDLKIIPLKDLQESTNNFAAENLIGEGGFGKVYKGKLFWSGELIDIAARKLHRDYGQGDLEFWHEISMLSNLEHANLVSFIGYCDEKGVKIIVNKYEASESLDKYIKDPKLTWTQRLQICVKIARALSYLQDGEGHDSSVIHRNIKSSKILLDQNWEPKLSGFGVSMKNTRARKNRLLLAEVVGTLGYVDPTYEKTGFVTHKSDVYSFGVLMFEMLCGKKAFAPDDQREEDSPQFLVEKSSSTNAMVPLKSKAEKPSFENHVLNKQNTERAPYKARVPSYEKQNTGLSIADADGPPKSFERSQPKSLTNNYGPSLSFERSQPKSITNYGPSFSSEFEGKPNSFVDVRPSSHVWGQTPTSSEDQPRALSRGELTTISGGAPGPHAGSGPNSFHGGETPPSSEGRSPSNTPENQLDYVGISLVGRRFKDINPNAYYVEKN